MAWGISVAYLVQIITDFAAPGNVSTTTPLTGFLDLGPTYLDLVFTLRNHDLTNNAAFYINTSQGGVAPDSTTTEVIVPPNSESTVTFRDVLNRYFELSASGDPNAAFPTVAVSFQIVGKPRVSHQYTFPRKRT